MAEASDNLTTPKPTRHPGAATELANSLCSHLTVDQLELLRIYARCLTCDSTRAQFIPIASSFSQELPRRKQTVIGAVINDMVQGAPFATALRNAKHANFRLIEHALSAAKEQNCLTPFLEAVLDYELSKRPLALLHQDTLRKKLVRLSIKTLIILQGITFILLFIVPEFKKMSEDFGAPLPPILETFIWVSVVLVTFWFIPALLLICLVIYLFFFSNFFGRLFTRLTGKFSPWRWLDRPLSKTQRRQMAFAWLGNNPNDSQRKSPVNQQEAEALEIASSLDTRFWLIRHSQQQADERKWRRRNRFGNAFIIGWNAFLALSVAVVAIGIVSSLLAFIKVIL